jgi:hypothetical protein
MSVAMAISLVESWKGGKKTHVKEVVTIQVKSQRNWRGHNKDKH